MIGQGCDVVFGVGGNTGNGGLLAAKEKGLMAIGVDVDQYNTYPEVKDALVTSAAKNVDVAVYEYLKRVNGRHGQGRHRAPPTSRTAASAWRRTTTGTARSRRPSRTRSSRRPTA